MQIQRVEVLRGQRAAAASAPRALTKPHIPRRAATVAANAASSTPSSTSPLLMSVVEGLFKFPPLFKAAAKKARSTIVDRGEALGLNWAATMAARRAHDWEAALQAVADPSVTYPEYYTQPFHAYEAGNLNWEAALELTLAAQSVHATVMDPAGKTLRADGDEQLRSTYMARTRELMAQLGADASAVKSIADLGCATGLSSLALLRAFPGAAVTGVDLSPHFLAVARYEQRERAAAAAAATQAASGSGPNAAAATAAAEPLTFVHAAAEDTKLPAGSFDLVGMCLVAHELPGEATRAVLREAYRLLKPGGVMSIMEMNPQSPAFQRIFNNPIAFAAFKSTEPHLASYMALDLADAYVSAGFEAPLQAENTPRHRTVVGRKPLSAA